MQKIYPDDAYLKVLGMLRSEQMEDRLYEFAQDLFHDYIKQIESNKELQVVGEDGTPYDNEDFQMWYDDYYDVFIDDVLCVAYNKLRSMME